MARGLGRSMPFASSPHPERPSMKAGRRVFAALSGLWATPILYPNDRSVRPAYLLSTRFGDRSLRLPLRLLHGGRHDLFTEGRDTVAGRARPAVQRFHPKGREEATPDGRRAAGAAEHHEPLPLAWPPS